MSGDAVATEVVVEGQGFQDINGNKLPDKWPEIMPLEEHENIVKKVVGTTEQEAWNPVEKLSFRISTPDGSRTLEYEAVVHSKDINHPQFKSLEEKYKSLKPDIVLYEAPSDSSWIAPSAEEAIRIGGEVAYVQFLAKRDGVESKSFDISRSDWVFGLIQAGYSNEDIAAYESARWVYRYAQDASEKGILLTEAESRLREIFKDSDLAKALKDVPRKDDKEWTYELASAEYKRITGEELSYQTDNPSSENNYRTLLRKMVDDEDKFREKRMIQNIAEAIKTHSKVMAVAGSSHPVRQRAALETFMGVQK